MPWSEDKDSRKRPSDGGASNAPPDLMDLLGALFGFKKNKSKKSGSFENQPPNRKRPPFGSGFSRSNPFNFSLILGIVLIVWLLSGIYIISEGQRGVILRFGEYREVTLPGPHWHFPYPIETAEKVDVDKVRSAQNKVSMLTQDENIVEVELAVQYRVKDAANYLFNVRLPDIDTDRGDQSRGTLFQVMESALREVIGKNTMDFILGEGRAEIAAKIKVLMQTILDEYVSGLIVLNVNLQQSQPPAAVQGSFADAVKAREDEIRFVNEAEAYSNGIIPQARGEAARMLAEANAYRDKVVENSKGEAARFNKLFDEYRKAPEVTRERLYIEALQSVLSKSNKVMVNVEDGNNVFYLPLNRMLEDATRRTDNAMSRPPAATSNKNKNNNTQNARDRIRSGIEQIRGNR
ncbi:MAG: FtsH protease activity modulator HflK [Chromatiales bacterium]|nr:FtsH protease activity modulator HflK [Chromatiales bacterium]